MSDQDWDNFNWELFEQDQASFEDELTRAAFENTYLIITGKATSETMLDKKYTDENINDYLSTATLFNPLSGDDPKFPHLHNGVCKEELIECMIEYYIETEEYEKCAELSKYRKKLC